MLLPVGTDYTPPNKWVTEIHRDWNARYTWPRFVCALPSEFFAAVRAELDERGAAPSPQTRDMNPIYTGKDVSYIDTKQANRAAENAVLEAERFAVFAGLLAGATYPEAALAKAWVQLAYGAHHDAITGSESDQVYLDLLTSWRDAWELGRTRATPRSALLSDRGRRLGRRVEPAGAQPDRRRHRAPRRAVRAAPSSTPTAAPVPVLVEHDGHSVSWLARDVPSLGWRSYRFVAGDAASGWEPLTGDEIGNEHYRLRVDPARGGGVSSLTVDGRELIADGPRRQRAGRLRRVLGASEGRRGAVAPAAQGARSRTSAGARATSMQRYRSALGERIVVTGRIENLLRYTQTHHAVARRRPGRLPHHDRRVHRRGPLLRLRWPCPVPGAMPVSEVGDAVIGRGFGLTHDRGATESR